MEGVIWGLLGATLIGGSDVVARVTAQKVSLSVLFLAVMGLSFVAHFLYRALARGPVTVASPAASSFVVILVALNVMGGQPFSGWQVLAALIVFAGVALLAQHDAKVDAATNYDADWLRITALFGLAAAGSIALRMFLAQEATVALGVLPALYLNRVFALLAVFAMLAWQWQQKVALNWPSGGLRWLVLLQAVLETVALSAFLFGSQGTGRVGAAIGFAAFAAVSAIIARVWLSEPIGARRSIWMGVVALGVALAAMTGPAAS